MFDPDGDQAAADSTRSSTSVDTGSSLNPRTARRLVTASYTSMMIASLPPAIRFVQTHAVVSFGPNPTSGQYSQGPGTQRKTSPSTATWQTDGNDISAEDDEATTAHLATAFPPLLRCNAVVGEVVKDWLRRRRLGGLVGQHPAAVL